MNPFGSFWEDPFFWLTVLVLLFFAAMATFVICKGPGEIPFDGADEAQHADQLDLNTRKAWGLNPSEWKALTPEGRAFYRSNITKAPYVHEVLR
ncbi:hypothetical protein PBI_BRIDGETTE_44 [Arthrobacter phage Bridgette]|uniref:Uncharacterized protein n=1 Tax=Arthrobacter phage Bridgette TaxID=2419949 RepID=A0A3G2KEF5_9CAUD|nr:hypothetical protein HOU46_gp44 [Arthrobacter phage Bridgette]AYN57310.1 hypothetical protein PBI_BRIDGETTE_44 [Arthrobacter phage Bridgette]